MAMIYYKLHKVTKRNKNINRQVLQKYTTYF